MIQHRGIGVPSTRQLRASAPISSESESDACIRLEDSELPDFVDAEGGGTWYACDEPPADDPTLQCFQPEDIGGEPKAANDDKSWICVDTKTWAADREENKDDGY